MQLKKRWIYVVFVLTLLPVAASAQTSISGLPKLGGGVDIRGGQRQGSQVLFGNFGIGFNNGDSKISILVGIPTEDFGVPAYAVGIEGVHLYPLASDFAIFSIVEYYGILVEGAVAIPTTLIGGIGLSKNLGTDGMGLKPFVGLLYQRLEIISGTDTVPFASGFGARAGLEYTMSRFSVIGAVSSPIPLDSSQITYKVGINFFF